MSCRTDVSNSPYSDEPGTSQSHAERSLSKPTGLKLVLPPLKAGKPIKGIRRSNTGVGPSFIQEPETKKPLRPVKLKPLREVLTRLINQIKKKDDYAFFLEPVDVLAVPGYTDVVKHPMDLGTITIKVTKNKYRSLEEFASDIRLVTGNAKLFNPPGSIYYTEAERIETFALEHITKAAATVIEYETDWNIEIEQEESTPNVNIDDDEMDVDGSQVAASPAPSATQGPIRRGTRGPYKRPVQASVTESVENDGRLPGARDGLGAFPPGSDWAKLMLALKLKGRRYRTKKERLRMEKAGLPYCPDGSLDCGELEDPFSILSILVPEPLVQPQLSPIYSQTPPSDPTFTFPTPVNIPTPPYPPPPAPKITKRKYWNVNRYNPQRVYKNKEKEEEDNIPPWQVPRDAHALDFGPYTGLVGTLAEESQIQDIGTNLGSEQSVFDAIRRSADDHAAIDIDKPGQDEYWNNKTAADAQGYIRDIVYGGLEGLAYVRSLAEFVSPPEVSIKEEYPDSAETGLGMPLARYVEDFIVDPMTKGLHNLLRSVTQHLQDPSSRHPLVSTAITTQIDRSLNIYPSLAHTLRNIQQITTQPLDMACLIHQPTELFISENEWAGARWKEEKAKAAKEEGEPDVRNAKEYLAFAIKSHQEAQANGDYVHEGPEVLHYVLNYVADVIIELQARGKGKGAVKANGVRGGVHDEDARLRELRLNLLALAKRAPLDKIEKIPMALIPEHIRQFVPTLPMAMST